MALTDTIANIKPGEVRDLAGIAVFRESQPRYYQPPYSPPRPYPDYPRGLDEARAKSSNAPAAAASSPTL